MDVETRRPIEVPFLESPSADLEDLNDWLWAALASALTQGYATGLIVDRSGASLRPSQIELLAPQRVSAQVVPSRDMQSRRVVWRLDGQEIDKRELWHLAAYPAIERPLGLSPIGLAREAIGLGLAAQKYGASFFGEGGGPPTGYLATEQNLAETASIGDEEHAEVILRQWTKRHSGRRNIGLLDAGIKFVPLFLPPEESQFIETQKFSVAQVCRIFGVPPEMVAAEAGQSLTYANVEQRDLSLLKYAVSPWLVKFERKLSKLVPPGVAIKFNAASLLRTDLKTRYDAYRLALGDDKHEPWLTVDEVRELEDREPIEQETQPRRLKAVQ
jgi:HK97 family phage portal protein